MNRLSLNASGMVHLVEYARLVNNPEHELKAIMAYLDLEWDASMLDFNRLGRVVRTPSSEQVRRPLNRDGIGVWIPYTDWL